MGQKLGSPQLYRYNIDENKFYSATIRHKESASAAAFLPIQGKTELFLVTIDHCAHIVEWKQGSCEAKTLETVFCAETRFPNHGLSQAKCDPTGRLYTGTYDESFCSRSNPAISGLYSYDKYQGFKEKLSCLKGSDGLTFDIADSSFYHIASCTNKIERYSWDPSTGNLCKQSNVVRAIDLTVFPV